MNTKENFDNTTAVNGREIDLEEVDELSKGLKALTSLLFALADAEDGGFLVDSNSLNHLGHLAADCDHRLHNALNM